MFFDGAHGWNIDIDVGLMRSDPGTLACCLQQGSWKGFLVEGLHVARCWVLRDRNDWALPGWTVPLDLFSVTSFVAG